MKRLLLGLVRSVVRLEMEKILLMKRNKELLICSPQVTTSGGPIADKFLKIFHLCNHYFALALREQVLSTAARTFQSCCNFFRSGEEVGE